MHMHVMLLHWSYVILFWSFLSLIAYSSGEDGIILPWKINQLEEDNKSGFFLILNLDRGVCGVVSLHHLFMSKSYHLSHVTPTCMISERSHTKSHWLWLLDVYVMLGKSKEKKKEKKKKRNIF